MTPGWNVKKTGPPRLFPQPLTSDPLYNHTRMNPIWKGDCLVVRRLLNGSAGFHSSISILKLVFQLSWADSAALLWLILESELQYERSWHTSRAEYELAGDTGTFSIFKYLRWSEDHADLAAHTFDISGILITDLTKQIHTLVLYVCPKTAVISSAYLSRLNSGH